MSQGAQARRGIAVGAVLAAMAFLPRCWQLPGLQVPSEVLATPSCVSPPNPGGRGQPAAKDTGGISEKGLTSAKLFRKEHFH